MAFVNLYRSGYYHRQGKPNQYNCHPGDLYPTREAAVQDVDEEVRHLYLGTFEVIDVPESVLGAVNAPDSVPTPLSETRRAMAADKLRSMWPSQPLYRVPSHIEGMRPLVQQVDTYIKESKC